ncbi:amidohydrolase family protein [Salinarimonas sp.]|uniref:amidohydrolase family protein n=1 Tax=Salinarimonas sp. TaxID=2766526 RepID=UPI00391C1B91
MPLSRGARTLVERRLAHLAAVQQSVTIDADTHPSDPDAYSPELAERLARDPNYWQGRPIGGEELLRDLDQAGIDMALAWQNPAVTVYGADENENFERLLAANRYIARFAEANPTRIIPGGWTDPKALGLRNALTLARICVEDFGFPIVKMNPAQNAYPITDPMVGETVDAIVALGAIPTFHLGGDSPYTPPDGFAAMAARNPAHPIIGVHMGGGGSHFVAGDETYLGARRIGLEHENIFYVLSAKRDTHIESALVTYRSAGPSAWRRLAIGSDAPYGRPSWNFGGMRGLLAALSDGAHSNDPRLRADPGMFDEDAARDVLGRNFAALVVAAYERLLAGSSA